MIETKTETDRERKGRKEGGEHFGEPGESRKTDKMKMYTEIKKQKGKCRQR